MTDMAATARKFGGAAAKAMGKAVKVASTAVSTVSTVSTAAASTVANAFGYGAKIEEYPYRMLLIGETGAGKTSFLNLVCNCGMIQMLQRDFDARDCLELLRDFHDIQLESAALHDMQSRTSGAKLYSAVFGEMKMGIIDTPGFGDSRGLEQDERNVQSIIDILREEEYVNCVCLIVNGRQSRITTTLQYVLSEITAILPKNIVGNVIVVFTNTADPLDLNFSLDQLKPFFGQTVVNEHTFNIENPYCRLEKARMKHGHLPESMITKSLKKSFEDTAQVLEEMCKAMKDFKKVYTYDFISLYEKKQQIEENIVTLLIEIDNQKKIERSIAEAKKKAEAALQDKKLNTHFSVAHTYTVIEVVATGRHNTLCNAENCYSNCHLPCNLDKSLSSEKLKNCACMAGGDYCKECGHHYTNHYHIEKKFEERVKTRQFVDKDMRRRFNEAKSMEERERIFKETLEAERKESEKKRKELAEELLHLIEEFHKLGMTRNYAKVIQNQVEVIKRRLKSDVGPQSQDLQEAKEKLEQKLEVVTKTLQEPFSTKDANWARKLLELDQSQEPITEDMVAHAFRKLSKTEHPDKGGDGTYFQRLELARQILINSL